MNAAECQSKLTSINADTWVHESGASRHKINKSIRYQFGYYVFEQYALELLVILGLLKLCMYLFNQKKKKPIYWRHEIILK